jgi:hypothetical protein
VSLLPSVRATWAPRGHTPVLRHPFNWKRLSLAVPWRTNRMAAVRTSCSSCVLAPTTMKPLIEFLSDLNDLEQRPASHLGRIASASQSAHDRLGPEPT